VRSLLPIWDRIGGPLGRWNGRGGWGPDVH
jgi:hypothetical protein